MCSNGCSGSEEVMMYLDCLFPNIPHSYILRYKNDEMMSGMMDRSLTGGTDGCYVVMMHKACV